MSSLHSEVPLSEGERERTYLEPLLELAHDVPVLYLLMGLELAEGVVQLLQQGL